MREQPLYMLALEAIASIMLIPFLFSILLKAAIVINNMCAGGAEKKHGIEDAGFGPIVKISVIFSFVAFILYGMMYFCIGDPTAQRAAGGTQAFIAVGANLVYLMIVYPFFFFLVQKEFDLTFLHTLVIVSCFVLAVMILVVFLAVCLTTGMVLFRR